MNLIIDGRIINHNLTGIGRYTYELVKGLMLKKDVCIKLLTNNKKETEKLFDQNEKLAFISIKSKFLSPLEIIEIPLKINKYKKEYIYFTPSFCSNPFIKLKSFMTIHDINHIALPQYYSKFHQLYYNFIVKPSALKCNNIFTVSKFSKNEIYKWLNCQEDKIIVTYNGIDEKFKIINDIKIFTKVKLKYRLPEKFILYIGNLKLHKNVSTIIRAIKNVKKGFKLVINGQPNQELLKIIINNGIRDRIEFVGYIDEEDLPVIYNLAEAFVFISLYEGFGLPVIEAMACGCPTIISNLGALPEIANKASIIIDAEDYNILSREINNLIENKEIKEELINKGLINAERFNWGEMIDQTYSVIRNSW